MRKTGCSYYATPNKQHPGSYRFGDDRQSPTKRNRFFDFFLFVAHFLVLVSFFPTTVLAERFIYPNPDADPRNDIHVVVHGIEWDYYQLAIYGGRFFLTYFNTVSDIKFEKVEGGTHGRIPTGSSVQIECDEHGEKCGEWEFGTHEKPHFLFQRYTGDPMKLYSCFPGLDNMHPRQPWYSIVWRFLLVVHYFNLQ